MATANKKPVQKSEAKSAPAKKPAAKAAAPAKKPAVSAQPAAPAKKPAPAKKAVEASKPAAAKAAPAKPVAKTPAPKAAAKPAAPVKAAPAQAAAKPAPAKPTPKPVAKPAQPAAAATKVASKAMPATTKTESPAKAAAPTKKPAAKKVPAGKAGNGVISEAELLKMSDKDYMNAAQLEFFRHRLTTMKDEILVNARETGEHLKENEVFADPNDRATVEEENMLEQRVRDRERKLLKKIDSALRRIEEGEYGYCLETGDPIGIPRLLARPTAELSIEAQEKHERLEKLFAD